MTSAAGIVCTSDSPTAMAMASSGIRICLGRQASIVTNNIAVSSADPAKSGSDAAIPAATGDPMCRKPMASGTHGSACIGSERLIEETV